jgi:uncharacterized protein YbjT (DUF2867 family)
MFVITGTTGQVGGAVARTLLAAKQPMRAVVRDSAKAKPWAERGCDIAIAELTDVAAMTAAFKGADGVFILMPSNFDPEPGFPDARKLDAAITAALVAARPSKVVCLSTIGAQATEANLLNRLGMMEREFAPLPMPVAFLRAGWFMENAKWDVAPARETGMIRSFLQPLDKPVPMIATVDVGRVATDMLREPLGQGIWAQGLSNGRRIVELEGPRRVTPNDLAAAFTRALGRPVKIETVPRGTWADLFTAQGMKHPTPRIRMLDGFNEGWIAFESDERHTRKGTIELEVMIQDLVQRA